MSMPMGAPRREALWPKRCIVFSFTCQVSTPQARACAAALGVLHATVFTAATATVVWHTDAPSVAAGAAAAARLLQMGSRCAMRARGRQFTKSSNRTSWAPVPSSSSWRLLEQAATCPQAARQAAAAAAAPAAVAWPCLWAAACTTRSSSPSCVPSAESGSLAERGGAAPVWPPPTSCAVPLLGSESFPSRFC